MLQRLILALALLCFSSVVVAEPDTREVTCLAQNIYFEARGESLQGQVKVALVTLNRVYSERWPDTICGVVHQPNQFSWTLSPYPITDQESYLLAKRIARTVIQDYVFFENPGSTHYVRKDLHLKVGWTRRMAVSDQIGQHVFYTHD